MKSDVITHYIDGFVLEESDTSFHTLSSLINSKTFQDVLNRQQEMIAHEKEQKRKLQMRVGAMKPRPIFAPCLNCGRRISKQPDKPSDNLCPKCSGVENLEKIPPPLEEVDDVFSSSPSSPEMLMEHKSSDDPHEWSITDVCNFISSIPVARKYVDEFRAQDIDGPALLLLQVDHLISSMNFKLGPAMKLCSQIDLLRDEYGS